MIKREVFPVLLAFVSYTQQLSLDEIVQYANRLCADDGDEISLWKTSPTLNFLPLTNGLPDGTRFTVRALQPEDIGRYYDEFRSAADDDTGFSVEEIPTRRFFWSTFSRYYNCVIEETDTSKWIAVYYLTSSPFTRSKRSVNIDGGMVVVPEFRRRSLASPLIRFLGEHVSGKLGFEAFVSDTAIDHTVMAGRCVSQNMTIIGSLPCAVYGNDRRVNDLIIVYLKYGTHKSATTLGETKL